MKKAFKLIVIALAFASTAFAQTVTPCGISTPSCQSFVNGDNQNINKTLLSIGQTIANSATIAPPSGTTALSLSSYTSNTSGTVTAGSKSITFETSSDFVGTIDGVDASNNMIYVFSSGWNNTLPQIVFTVSAGTIRIRKIY